MLKNPIAKRRQTYFQLNSRLAELDNTQVGSLLGGIDFTDGGKPNLVKLGKQRIFVKRLPLTKLEYANQFSTANLYRLPTYFNYGVGSYGFGAFRETVAHIKTTNWVLGGAIENFPLLYHWRIIPFSGPREAFDETRHQGFVRYWNSNKPIDHMMRQKAAAPYEIILFLEYMPYTLGPWLAKNIGHLDRVIGQASKILSFLRRQNIIQFDAHYWNFVTDSKQIYLTDFGLVLDKNFALNKTERTFFANNRYYDCGEFLCGLADLLYAQYNNLSQPRREALIRQCALEEQLKERHIRIVLYENIERIHTSGLMAIDPHYLQMLAKYGKIIRLMQAFFSGMGKNNKKNTKYSHVTLRRLVKEVGFAD